jgi:hypothetical protein
MGKKSNNKIIGIILLVAGIGIAFWGYQMSGSFGGQLSKAFSGSPTDKVMMMYIGGAICAAVGLFMTSKK